MASMQQFHQPYVLPSFKDAVPESWRSNSAPKPPASSLQTVVISSLSGNQIASGHTDLSVPLGPSAGIMSQAYIKFTVQVTATNADTIRFKGAQHSALALINRYTTSVNGIALDTIANFDQSAGDLLNHCTSNDWIKNDSAVLMGSNVVFTVAGTSFTETFCIPLFGFLAGTIPSYLLNGQLNIGIDWNPVARAFQTVTGVGPTAFTISGVQLVYDRISPSQEFIDMVKAELRGGQKFVIPYVNIQNVNVGTSQASNNLSIGVNYSSLRSVLMSQVNQADYTTLANEGLSLNYGMNQFQVSCDGRLLSAVTYDTVGAPALCFLEAQKACGRAFDTSISDPCSYITAVNTASTVQVRSYLTNNFFAGCSGLRVAESLAFAGTPVSVLQLNWNDSALGGATVNCNITLLADMQALVDDQGNITVYR